jgi:hypothetical protein
MNPMNIKTILERKTDMSLSYDTQKRGAGESLTDGQRHQGVTLAAQHEFDNNFWVTFYEDDMPPSLYHVKIIGNSIYCIYV